MRLGSDMLLRRSHPSLHVADGSGVYPSALHCKLRKATVTWHCRLTLRL